MQYEIYYLNSQGTKLDFCSWPYMIYEGELFDYDWSFDSSTNYGSYGSRITRFNRPLQSKSLGISVFGNSNLGLEIALTNLTDAFEHDIASQSPGKLYVNGYYLECYITSVKPVEWVTDSDVMDVSLTITAEYPFWIKEHEYRFDVATVKSENNKGFPLRFPYRYPSGQTNVLLNLTGVKPRDFVLAISGPATDPKVMINDKIYGIIGTVEDRENLIINSRKAFVRKYTSDAYENVYDARVRDNGIYDKIKDGNFTVDWNGEFAFSLVIYDERSMPKWR